MFLSWIEFASDFWEAYGGVKYDGIHDQNKYAADSLKSHFFFFR